MRESYWGYWIILLGIFVIVIMMLVSNVTTTNTQDYYLIKEVAEASMVDAVDLAYYRQSGELRINKEKFVENFLRRFAENVALSTYKVDFYGLYEAPPKVSVKVTTKSASYSVASSSESFDIVNKLDAILELDGSALLEAGSIDNTLTAPLTGINATNNSALNSNQNSSSNNNNSNTNNNSNNNSSNSNSNQNASNTPEVDCDKISTEIIQFFEQNKDRFYTRCTDKQYNNYKGMIGDRYYQQFTGTVLICTKRYEVIESLLNEFIYTYSYSHKTIKNYCDATITPVTMRYFNSLEDRIIIF